MEILIYRNDEEEDTAAVFIDAREAIEYVKLRVKNEGCVWEDFIFKIS